MSARRVVLTVCIAIVVCLSACTTTPKLHLIKSSGVFMELEKPASYVFSVLFSPDGIDALAGSLDNVVTVWDLETGRMAQSLKAETGEVPGVGALGMSRDGRYLLTGMKGGGWPKLWDARTWQEIRELPRHSLTEAMEAFAFSPDNRYALTGGSYKINQWDMATGKELGSITHASFFDRNQSHAIAFSPDAGRAFVKGIGFISLWDIGSRSRLWIYGADTIGQLWIPGGMFNSSARFSPDGRYVLSGEGEILRLRDAASGRVVRAFADQGSGRFDAVAFSADGKYALSGSTDGNVRLWEVRTGVKLKQFAGHSDEVAAVAFSPDGRRALSGGDASTRLWDVATGEEIATMMEFNKSEWLVITPEGYYNSSENGAQYLSVTAGDRKYGVDRFYDVFYRPDIVAAKLKGENIRDLITIKMSDAIKSPPPIVQILPPEGAGSSKVKVCYQVKNGGGGIGEVRLFHNGKLIHSDGYYREVAKLPADRTALASLDGKAIYADMRSITVKGKVDSVSFSGADKGEVFEDCQEVETIPGENEVNVAAFNGSNTVQSSPKTINFSSSAKSDDPRLYILAIGIDRYRDMAVNLKYAVKDAKDLEEKLKVRSATLYKPENIHYALLTDEGATKTNITGKISELSKIIKPNDSFILFVAGHGVLLQNQYYMLTHDFDGYVNDGSMISSNEIVEMSKKIKSLSQLFIFDTCHAGGVDNIVSGLYDARMSVLARKMGLHIYASAGDRQSAMDGYKGNGLFTYTLLDGLNNNREADR
ncbi:MAG: caspase family protein, partial [Syntrophales bacterium]|nr:caspase family protein [Syntrophales bacterium]